MMIETCFQMVQQKMVGRGGKMGEEETDRQTDRKYKCWQNARG